MSKRIDAYKGIVEVPEDVTSQDFKADGNKSDQLPKGHQNTSVNPNDRMTSKNQETGVSENKPCRKGGNTQPTNTQSTNTQPTNTQPTSTQPTNTQATSTQPQDESPSLDPKGEPTAIDNIPNIVIHPDWINRTVYNADTHKNDFVYEAVQHNDPQLKGIAGETVHDISQTSSRRISIILVKKYMIL